MLRWGLLGTSFISDTMAQAIQKCEGSDIAAVAGRGQDKADAFAAKYGVPKAYDGYAVLLADPNVDVIYIGLPNHVHHEWTIKAAAADKHVLCEKSLSTDMEKTAEMLDAVQSSGVFFVEGLMYRAHPVNAKLADIVKSGRLGTIRSVTAAYHADIAQFVNADGKGVLFNLGCYPVSLLQMVVESAGGQGAFDKRAMQAFGARSLKDGNICDAATVVQFENGILATVQTSETHGMAHVFTVTGQDASLSIRTNPWLPTDGDNLIEIIDHASGAVAETIVVHSGKDAFQHQVEMVEAAIAAGASQAPFPSPTPSDSRQIMGFLTEWEALIGRRG